MMMIIIIIMNRETEGEIIAAQDKALKNHILCKIILRQQIANAECVNSMTRK